MTGIAAPVIQYSNDLVGVVSVSGKAVMPLRLDGTYVFVKIT